MLQWLWLTGLDFQELHTRLICMCFHQSTCFWGRPSTNDDDWALVTLRLVCKCQRTDLVVSNLPLLIELKVAEMSAVRVEFSGIWHSQLTCNFLFASIHLLLRQTKYCKTFENFHSVTKAESREIPGLLRRKWSLSLNPLFWSAQKHDAAGMAGCGDRYFQSGCIRRNRLSKPSQQLESRSVLILTWGSCTLAASLRLACFGAFAGQQYCYYFYYYNKTQGSLAVQHQVLGLLISWILLKSVWASLGNRQFASKKTCALHGYFSLRTHFS